MLVLAHGCMLVVRTTRRCSSSICSDLLGLLLRLRRTTGQAEFCYLANGTVIASQRMSLMRWLHMSKEVQCCICCIMALQSVRHLLIAEVCPSMFQ